MEYLGELVMVVDQAEVDRIMTNAVTILDKKHIANR